MKTKWIKDTNKRLYKGVIFDVKSYKLEKAIRLHVPIRGYIADTGRWITILPEKFSEGAYGTRLWKSKHKGGQDYYLVSFSVRSDVVKEAEKKEQEEVSVNQALFKGIDLDRLAIMKKQIFKH